MLKISILRNFNHILIDSLQYQSYLGKTTNNATNKNLISVLNKVSLNKQKYGQK
jgi:hypothetical protein